MQFWFAGIWRAILGLIGWSIIWAPIALIHNLIFAGAWSYLGFWVAIMNWEQSSWSDLLHANIGVGIASLFALASASNKATETQKEELATSEETEKK